MRTLAALLLLVSCAAQPSSNTEGEGTSPIEELRAAGLTMTARGPVEQPFLSVEGRVFEVEGGDLQVYTYASEAAAQADASKISPDGQIETVMISWMAPPHFYRRGKTLAIYVGAAPRSLNALQRVLGPAFAEHK